MNLSDTNILEPIGSKKTFFSHVFSTTEEGKAEILNVAQYSLLGIIPIILLNKLIQRFIPDADADKSSVEVLIEVLIQLIVFLFFVLHGSFFQLVERFFFLQSNSLHGFLMMLPFQHR